MNRGADALSLWSSARASPGFGPSGGAGFPDWFACRPSCDCLFGGSFTRRFLRARPYHCRGPYGSFWLAAWFSGGFPRFSDNLRRLGRQGSHRATSGLGGIFRRLDTRLGYLESCLRRMDHRALHGRENALLLLVVLIHGRPPLFPTQKLASFDATVNARKMSPTANLKGA